MPLELSTDQLRVMYMRMTRLGCINHLRHELEREPNDEIKIAIIRQVIDEKTQYLNSVTHQ